MTWSISATPTCPHASPPRQKDSPPARVRDARKSSDVLTMHLRPCLKGAGTATLMAVASGPWASLIMVLLKEDKAMLAYIAAIIFAIAFLINATSTSTNAVFSPISLLLVGLACLALHLAGVGTGWSWRGRGKRR